MILQLSKQEATDFFSKIYGGEHHIPDYKVREFGYGWCVHHMGDLATFDHNMLTRFVLLAHERCYRLSINPVNFNKIKICIWKRQRTPSISTGHPTIEESIELFKREKS